MKEQKIFCAFLPWCKMGNKERISKGSKVIIKAMSQLLCYYSRLCITRTRTGNRKIVRVIGSSNGNSFIERKCSTGPEKWFELRRCSSNRDAFSIQNGRIVSFTKCAKTYWGLRFWVPSWYKIMMCFFFTTNLNYPKSWTKLSFNWLGKKMSAWCQNDFILVWFISLIRS